MGLTERHWFENEDIPENYERALEDAVYNSRTQIKSPINIIKDAGYVLVVRCKDCKHYHKGFNCDLMQKPIFKNDDWFCADGEWRESE